MAVRKRAEFSVILILVLSLGLVACGDTPTSVPTQPPANTTANPTSTTIVAATPTIASTTSIATTVPTTTAAPTTAATTQPKTLALLTPTPGPTGTAQTNAAGYVYYLKEGALWSVRADGTGPRKLADKVYSYLRTSNNELVFFQQVKSGNDEVLQLKLLKLAQGASSSETVLDNKTFVLQAGAGQSGKPASRFGVDERAVGKMAVSPDGSLVTYTKTNFTTKPFSGLDDKELPTELWIANLSSQNPAPRRIVANDKDYISRPLWSLDNNRISFIRTENFGTGAGFPSAIWSVYKDGTRLVFLTGPDLGTVNGQNYRASPAFNMQWVGPYALAFQASYQSGAALWLHDLTQNSDFPRPLALDASYINSKFCQTVKRFIYVKLDPQTFSNTGVFSVDVERAGTGGAAPTAVALDATGSTVFDCYGDAVLYLDAQGQIFLQKIKADGSATGNKIKLGNPVASDKGQVIANFSPDGKFIVITAYEKDRDVPGLYIYRGDGSGVPLTGAFPPAPASLHEWYESKVVAFTVGGAGINSQLVTVDLSLATPAIKIADSSKDFINLVSTGN